MKKFITLSLTLLLILAFSLSSSASSVSVATEITNIRTYYAEKTEFTSFEQTIAMASMGMLAGRKAYYPENDGSAITLARRILSYTASGETPEGYMEPEELKKLQSENGGFGSVETHCLAILALTASKTLYNSAKAYEYLISQQKENGSFGDNAKDTALAITAFSLTKNDAELSASAKAVRYLVDYSAPDEISLCWQIIGITNGNVDANTAGDRNLLETLMSYQNKTDYTFYRTQNDTKSDEEATVMALLALDAINRDSDALKRLAENGKLSLYELADMRPLIIFGAVLLAVSIGFWIFIFLHKKSTKTLDETKTY